MKAIVFSSLNATTIWLLSPNRTSLRKKKKKQQEGEISEQERNGGMWFWVLAGKNVQGIWQDVQKAQLGGWEMA